MRIIKGNGLAELGERLAKIDKRLVAILAERMRLSIKVARCKMNNGNEPILRKQTERRRRLQWMEWARKEGLDPEFARTVFSVVLGESCRIQIETKEGKRI